MKKYNVPALEKAMAILELLDKSELELTVTEIHTQLDIPKATTFMILNVLENYRVVRKSSHGRYSLGPKIYTLGMSYMTKMDLKKVAKPYLDQLTNKTKFTSHLGVMDSNGILFIAKVEIPSFIKFSTFPGMRSQLHNTSMGKAILANLPDEEIEQIVDTIELGRYTPNTITDKTKFKEVLKRIKETGYAVEDEEGEIGVRCIGAPIFDIDNKVIAAVSITALKADLPVDLFQEVGNKVMDIARKISTDLGHNFKD